jgi:hypothetical protein
VTRKLLEANRLAPIKALFEVEKAKFARFFLPRWKTKIGQNR